MITPKLLTACREQWEKYSGKREMDEKCELCKAVSSTEWEMDRNCRICPLSSGGSTAHCTSDGTYIKQDDRLEASTIQRAARADRLIEIYEEHGIFIHSKGKEAIGKVVIEEKLSEKEVLKYKDLKPGTGFFLFRDEQLRIRTNKGHIRFIDSDKCYHESSDSLADQPVELVDIKITRLVE